jgi:hypothetical protein
MLYEMILFEGGKKDGSDGDSVFTDEPKRFTLTIKYSNVNFLCSAPPVLDLMAQT